MNTDERLRTMEDRLTEALRPESLTVTDDSADHIGHAGAQQGGGHFTVTIIASGFEGKTLPERHRMVYDALSDMMGSEIHALSIRAKPPANS